MNPGSGVVNIGIVGFIPPGAMLPHRVELIGAPGAPPEFVASHVAEITVRMGGTVSPVWIGNSDLANLSTPSSVPRTAAEREAAGLAVLFGSAHDAYSGAAEADAGSSIKLGDMLAIIERTQTSQLLQQINNLAEDALIALLPEDAAKALCALVRRTAEIEVLDRVQAIWRIIDAASDGNVLANNELVCELKKAIGGLKLFYGLGLGIHLAEKLAAAGARQAAQLIYRQAKSDVADIPDEDLLFRITQRAILASSLFKFDQNAGCRLIDDVRRDGAVLVRQMTSLGFEDLLVVIERLGNAIGALGETSIKSELARLLRIAVRRIAKPPLPNDQDELERLLTALEGAAPLLSEKNTDEILRIIVSTMIAAARKVVDPARRATQLALAATTAIDHDFLEDAEDAIVEAHRSAKMADNAEDKTRTLISTASISIRLRIANLTEQILRDALSSLAQMASDAKRSEVIRITRIISHNLLPADVRADLLGRLSSLG